MVEVQDVTEHEEGPTLRQRGPGNAAAVVAESGDGEENVEVVPQEQELSFDEQVDQARAQYQPTAMEKFLALAKSLILRALVVYFVMSFIRGNNKPSGTNSTSTTPGSAAPASLASSNIYNNGTEFDMYVYISEDSHSIRNFTNAQLIWKQEGLMYGDWYGGPNADGTYSHSSQVRLSKKAQNNGTVYIHAYVLPLGFKPWHNPDDTWVSRRTIHGVKQLNKFKRRKYAKTHNLLSGETAASIEEQEKAKIMSSSIESHWHPNMTVTLVFDWTAWTMGAVPPPLNEYVQFIPQELMYKPVLFFNDYWNLAKDYTPINSSTPVLPITITFQPLSLFKWQIYAAQSMRNQWQANFMMSSEGEDEDQDALKEAILETNPYLLGLTFIVSILHSIFEFLAFKNDIQFWNNRKSLEGLSVRSVFFNVFQSVIVLLYVLDNETNFVIRVSVFVGLLIEIWKINKVLDVKIDRTNPILGVIPRVSISDKGSYVESSTRQYDVLAFRYLSWALFPLLVGYAVYSVVYMEHKGWYSWVLSMLYGFLLTFGFIMMTPQLFINYKLKSVAHLPWRMLSYKFLNTFIDDIFAFVIKMPTMYRIGTLRDDIIFFIYLYQRYVYRIDPSRVNEFGYSGDMLDNNEAKTAPAAVEDTSQKALTEGEASQAGSSSSPDASKKQQKSQNSKSRSKSNKEKKVQ